MIKQVLNNEFTKEEKAKLAKRAYMKQWRAENRDKVKANQERYWTKKYLNSSQQRGEV